MLIFNQTLTIKTRLWLNFGLVISILSGIGIFVLIQMQALTDTTNKLYKHPYTVTKSIKEVDTNLNQMRNHLLTLLLDKDASHLNSQIAAIDAIKNDVQVKSTLIKERFLGDQQEVNALIVEFNKLTELREKTIQLLKSGNLDQAIEFALGGDHSKQFELVVQQINKIENFANNKAESFMNNAQLQSRQIRIVTITIITVAIGLIWWMMFFLFRAINRPLSQAVEIADAISGGNFDNQIIIKTKDEIGQLLEALSCMQTQLRTRLEEDNRIAEEINAVTQLASQGDFSQRLQVESKKGMFKVIADSINQVLIANQLAIQDLIHVFAAVAQGDLTKTITNNYQGELAKLKQDANATVQKLTQVTEEIGIATRTASQGDFSKRINLENKTGTFRLLGESINQVLDYNQLAIKDLTRVFSAVAQGNLTEIITNNYQGELAQLKQDANATVQKLTQVTEEIGIATRTASQGDFSKRINLENKTGTFRLLGESINQVLDYNQLAIKDLTRVFSAVAQGNLTETITNNYQGELAQLKQDANATVQKLTQVTEEIGIATRTASQGDFSKRINLENKTGTFRLLGESINQVLDYNQLAIKDLTRVFSAVAQGNLTETIINNYQGELAQLKQDANATVQKLTLVTEEIAEVTHAAAQGNFGKRIALEKKTGTFRILGESINQVLDYNQLAIKDLMRVFAAIAQGNLTQTITNDYSGELAQLKQDANATVAKLMEVMGIIKQSSTMVNHAAGELSQANANLSQRATQQAASLEETAASMQQMTGTVQQNSENAKQANLLANNARERAELGNQVVNTAVVAINEISKSSKKIGEIVSVIDEIAFQTNLLALNAAVEAARAGEQGRGFAVVATEVRTLAQRSATAAKEIKALIQDSNLKMDEGIRLGNQSGQTLTEIVMAVKKVNDIISEIAAASIEQSQGIEQVNKAITQMDEMVEQNSALVEQTAAASESMSDQAQTLRKQVAFFKMNETPEESSNHASFRPKSKTAPVNSTSSSSQTKAKPKPVPTLNKEEWTDF